MTNHKVRHLSIPQLNSLQMAAEQKLRRGTLGWAYETGPHSCIISSPATIKSLWRRGLLNANFDDPRGFEDLDKARQVNNLDGARFPHSPEVQMLCVWANWRGMEILRSYGWIEDEETPKVIH